MKWIPHSAVFMELRAAGFHGTRSEGGVFQESLKRYSTTDFSYLSHSAVVIPYESAHPLPTREKGGDQPPTSWFFQGVDAALGS